MTIIRQFRDTTANCLISLRFSVKFPLDRAPVSFIDDEGDKVTFTLAKNGSETRVSSVLHRSSIDYNGDRCSPEQARIYNSKLD